MSMSRNQREIVDYIVLFSVLTKAVMSPRLVDIWELVAAASNAGTKPAKGSAKTGW